jgi:hypothetical protein
VSGEGKGAIGAVNGFISSRPNTPNCEYTAALQAQRTVTPGREVKNVAVHVTGPLKPGMNGSGASYGMPSKKLPESATAHT